MCSNWDFFYLVFEVGPDEVLLLQTWEKELGNGYPGGGGKGGG